MGLSVMIQVSNLKKLIECPSMIKHKLIKTLAMVKGKIFDLVFFTLFSLTLIFLGVFNGIYLAIKVNSNLPEYSYYFEGGVSPTTGQFMVMSFYDGHLMLSLFIISFATATIFRFLNMRYLKTRTWIWTTLALTMLTSAIYFIY